MGIELNHALYERIDVLRDRKVRFEILRSTIASGVLDEVRRLVLQSSPIVAETLDASDKVRQAVFEWLRKLPISPDQQVLVLWPQYDAGIQLSFIDFANYYDELWYPAADDVWVTDDRRSWLLQVDHEETLTFLRKPPADI